MVGKRVLFLSPVFFNLYVSIIEELEHMGTKVDFFDERPSNGFLAKAFIRKNVGFYRPFIRQYYKNILNETKEKKYDYVFIIKCETVPIDILAQFRAQFSNAVFIVYLWDSIKNIPNIQSKLPFFDRVLSFDTVDVENNPKILFRPLYYSSHFKKFVPDFQYDIAFVGTAHSIRPKIVLQIQEQCLNAGLRSYFYLYMPHPLLFFYNKIFNKHFRGISINDVHFKSLPIKDVSSVYDNTHCVLDIEHIDQTGLTMRVLEVLGMRKKLITTNINCLNYDFYKPNNIFILNKDNPIINTDFLNTPYDDLPDDIYARYSLRRFIEDIFDWRT